MRTLTPTDYFDAALDLLGENGAEALTLAALCDRVGVTKGSFYHHFDSMPAFHERVLAHFATDALDAAVQHAMAVTNPRQRLAVLRHLGVASAHETEVAVRAWATWYEPAAQAHRRIEQRRRGVLVTTFLELGIAAPQAGVLARIGTALMMGMQSDGSRVDRAALDEVLTEYQRWIEASIPAT